MKRYLLLIIMSVLVSIGTWAANFTWTDGTYTVTASNVDLNGDVFQKLEVSGPGALAAFVAATKDLSDSDGGPLKGVGGNSTRVNLRIEGELNADDFSSMNSTDVPRWGTFTSLKMDNATVADFSALSGMSMSGLKYLQLPGSLANVDDMKTLKGKNSNLDIVIALTTEESEAGNSLKKAVIQSFTANSVPGAYNAFRDGQGYSGFTALRDAKVITMSGEYGDKDLYDNTYNGQLYNNSPAVWDFTGAHFADCTVNGGLSTLYYNYDNPFQDPAKGSTSTAGNNYSTNAFWYFNAAGYPGSVVSIKLPDTNMTSLPPRSLYKLAYANKDNYILLYGEDAFSANQAVTETGEKKDCVPIETLEIPSCYELLDYECAAESFVTNLFVGSGMKAIQGGAFSQSFVLENLDFESGVSDCYLGESAFSNCQKMKHIALNEGIVSVGANCFHLNKHLESIRLPQSLLYIGNGGFDDCQALNSITIPENVKQIGQGAFIGCPFTDIYLTTTDPDKIPLVWSCGTQFTNFDGRCTFNHGHLDGWEGGVDGYQAQIDGQMTWDEAAAFYYLHWNGMPVLHFPRQLAEKVRSEISSSYAMKTAVEDGKQYGLPKRVDMDKRDNIPGADLGTSGTGKYTRDGWAQFMMMKEYTTDPGGDVYKKEYDDVWYTMCFPFDLSDEQLAAAFNETFNIVDFSGVEIKEPTETTGKKLILHFNNVAITDYKDTEGNHYERVLNTDGTPVREKHGSYNYNVYKASDGTIYHHVHANDKLTNNKTKSFAPGSTLEDAANHKDQAVLIDGILATAGHPYMIHPAIGFNDGGNNKKTCTFSGIDWLPRSRWAEVFEAQKRTIDLGVEMGTIDEEEPANSIPDKNNFLQAEYTAYKGQTYTFIGNWDDYRDDAQGEGTENPLRDEPQVPEEPVKPIKPTAAEIEALRPSGTEPTTEVQNPETNSRYSDDFKALFKTVRASYTGWHAPTADQNHLYEFTYGEDLVNYESNEFLEFRQWHNNVQVNAYFYKTQTCHNSAAVKNIDALKAVLGDEPVASLDGFSALKQLAIDYQQDIADYANYQLWVIYYEKKAEFDNWSEVEAKYDRDKAAYEAAVRDHKAWETEAEKWKIYIPKNAYFLGRKKNDLPKYYREVAENPEEGKASTRKGGAWSQFTAIVIPNDAAVAGIERELDGKTAQSKGFDMAFDEGFLGEVISEDEAVTLIENAQEEGAKVEYMDIVVSINGQVVRRGSTSLEGLPKGIYIINGKKYFVK